MTFYSLALFLHIVGALGVFVALGWEWMSLLHLRRALTIEQVREWLEVLAWIPRIAPASLGVILLTGFYMTAVAWGGAGWIIVAFGAIIILWALGAGLTGRRMAAIGRGMAAERGAVSPVLRDLLRHPLLWTSFQLRTAIVLGIVFLMTIKPALGGALLTIGVAILLGLASTWPLWSRSRVQDPATSLDK